MEFPRGKISDFAPNVIAESMYAQCDVDINEYISLEAYVDHRKNGSSLSVEEQKIVINGGETLKKSKATWDICCKWKDGSMSWKRLTILRCCTQSRLSNMP